MSVHRPVTGAAKAMMKEQVPPHICYFQKCADCKTLPIAFGEPRAWPNGVHLHLEELVLNFVDRTKRRQVEHVTNDVHLSQDLKKHAGIWNGPRTNRGSTKLVPAPRMCARTFSMQICTLHIEIDSLSQRFPQAHSLAEIFM